MAMPAAQIQKAQQSAPSQRRGLTIKELLESRRGQMAELMPKHLTPDRLIKVSLNTIFKSPKLQKCTASSLMASIVTAAELGLEPGGALGHAYLVPFKDQCQLIIGYRGFIELMRRSGSLVQIEAHVVHEHDDFKVEFGLNPIMRHVPTLAGDPGKPVMVYMLARLKDGGVHCELMTISDVERVRARSRSRDEGPWVTDYEEMCKKTVVRRGAKYLPLSAEMTKAIEADDQDFVDAETIEHKALAADNALAMDLVGLDHSPEPVSKANEKAKEAVRARSFVTDVQPDETEEEALAREARETEARMVADGDGTA